MKNAKQILEMIDDLLRLQGINEDKGEADVDVVESDFWKIREELWRLSEGTKHMNNGEWLEHVCDFNIMGGPFIIDWLRKGIRSTILNQEELRESMKDSSVNPETWIKTAYDLKKAYEEKYENTIDVGDAPIDWDSMKVKKLVEIVDVSPLVKREQQINSIVSEKIKSWESEPHNKKDSYFIGLSDDELTDSHYDELIEDFREEAYLEINIKDMKVHEIVTEKIRRWESDAGGQSVLIDDLPPEAYKEVVNKFREEAILEIKQGDHVQSDD